MGVGLGLLKTSCVTENGAEVGVWDRGWIEAGRGDDEEG